MRYFKTKELKKSSWYQEAHSGQKKKHTNNQVFKPFLLTASHGGKKKNLWVHIQFMFDFKKKV